MNKILEILQEKLNMGYGNNQLEVSFGYVDEESETEGYYISKLNGWGSTPITEVLVSDGKVNDDELIKELDKLDIAHCF